MILPESKYCISRYKISKSDKCGKVIAETKELIRIMETEKR